VKHLTQTAENHLDFPNGRKKNLPREASENAIRENVVLKVLVFSKSSGPGGPTTLPDKGGKGILHQEEKAEQVERWIVN